MSPLNYPKYKFIQPLEKSEKAKERVFLESAKNEFFGLNTTVFKNEGVLNGVYNKLQDYYKDTAVVSLSLSVCLSSSSCNSQDYLSDVYSLRRGSLLISSLTSTNLSLLFHKNVDSPTNH